MKKLKKCFLLLLVLAIALTNNNTAAFAATRNISRKISIVKVSDIELNKSATQLIAGGEKEILAVTVYPFNATNKYVTWRSSNSNVARVSNGIVTPIAEGSAVITATSSANKNIKEACIITVVPQPEPVVSKAETVVPQPEAVVLQSEPVLAQPEPLVAQQTPVVPQPEPVVPQSEPVLAQLEPLVAQQTPVVPQPESVVPAPIINEKSVLEFKCDDGQYVKGDGIHDDTTGIQRALNSGGNISFVSDCYTYKVTSELSVPSDTVIDGKNATIKAPSTAKAKNIFRIVNKQNITIENLKFESINDQARDNNVENRCGLTSNIFAIHISAGAENSSNNFILSNIHGENLEYLIKIDSYAYFNKNITLTDISTYNCVQPIFMTWVDGVTMNNIDLDQAVDVSKFDHHMYITDNSYNMNINNVIVRRGTTANYGNSIIFCSPNASTHLKNIKITNVRAENLNNNYVFAFLNLKNCVIDGFQAELTGSTLVWYYDVEDVTLTNFDVSGKITGITVGGNYIKNEYNKSITLKNSNIDVSFNGSNLFAGENITVSNNTFNLSQVSGNGTFMRLQSGDTAKYIIENNKINISKYPNNVGLFDIRANDGADILINNNTIINASGTDLNFILLDYTTADRTTKIAFTNNSYSGYINLYYIKTLAYLYNNKLM